jgi:hypothetical protein
MLEWKATIVELCITKLLQADFDSYDGNDSKQILSDWTASSSHRMGDQVDTTITYLQFLHGI